MKKKSDNNNDKVNNNNVEGERVVSTRDVRSVSSPALCSPAPRAAMLAVARGTAPNSLPDWSIWSRDRGAVVGVIGSPRLHTYAAHVTSLRCTGSRTLANHILRTSSRPYTNWKSTFAYTWGWIGIRKHGYGFRKEWETSVRMRARMWRTTTQPTSK